MLTLSTFIKRLLCRHKPTVFLLNIYGDEILSYGGKRSIWRCTDCGALVLQDELHRPNDGKDGP